MDAKQHTLYQTLSIEKWRPKSRPQQTCKKKDSGLVFSGCLELGGATGTPLVAQTVEHLPIMRDTQFQSLGQEDLLEKAMAPHSSILAGRIPWMEEPGGLLSMGSHRVRHDWSDLAAAAAAIDFPGGSDGKASAYNAGDPGSIPGSGRSLGVGNATHSSILVWKIP